MTERRADDATREVQAWLKCEYLREHVGDEFDGVVSAVTNFGLFVELNGLYIEGLVHTSPSLPGDYYRFDHAQQRLVGGGASAAAAASSSARRCGCWSPRSISTNARSTSSPCRVACGATETVPLVRVTNLARCLDNLKEAGLWIYGAAGEAEQRVYDCDLSGPLALVMGAEGRGLRRLTRERCDFLVSLPMAGAVSSLNVSVASGVFLFEAVRQRRPGADA
jgi:tRNA(Leu) C34 or U34 (ribose-2'-O)-methylase TrmL